MRGPGFKTQPNQVFLCFMFHVVNIKSMQNDARNRFFIKKKLSCYTGLRVKMLNLKFIAAAVSNY